MNSIHSTLMVFPVGCLDPVVERIVDALGRAARTRTFSFAFFHVLVHLLELHPLRNNEGDDPVLKSVECALTLNHQEPLNRPTHVCLLCHVNFPEQVPSVTSHALEHNAQGIVCFTEQSDFLFLEAPPRECKAHGASFPAHPAPLRER